MWARTVQGQALRFHLAGIHNQNFLMRDEQSGSFWQQVSGRCIAGPMKGAPLPADDVVMAVRVGPEARGYPVRIMAYHHVLNDDLGGVPLVITY